ncbi:hypothetical protein MBLNU13_g00162t1 [Cladosporium sp. NU13]
MEEEDYFVPLGMSQIDFNSMIRRCNLADLTGQLIEQGRVALPGTFTDPSSNAAKLVDVEHDVANAPDPLVADDENVARPCSSIYSCDIDEDTPSSTALIDSGRSSHTTPKTPEAGYWPLQPHTSNKTPRMSVIEPNTLPNSPQSAPSRATSLDAYFSGTAAPKAGFNSLEIDPWCYGESRMSGTKPHSLPAATSVVDEVRGSIPMLQGQNLHEGPLAHVVEASKKGDLDLPKAIAAQLRKFSRRAKLQELQPPVDRFIELARLRRAVHRLEFDFIDTIMISSDLTSVVHVPPLPSVQELQEMQEADDLANVFKTHEFFRWRLAKTVHNRLESLRRELRVGDVRKIEHWYRDVVDLVGWRDEDEARMSWSWLENDGFF